MSSVGVVDGEAVHGPLLMQHPFGPGLLIGHRALGEGWWRLRLDVLNGAFRDDFDPRGWQKWHDREVSVFAQGLRYWPATTADARIPWQRDDGGDWSVADMRHNTMLPWRFGELALAQLAAGVLAAVDIYAMGRSEVNEFMAGLGGREYSEIPFDEVAAAERWRRAGIVVDPKPSPRRKAEPSWLTGCGVLFSWMRRSE